MKKFSIWSIILHKRYGALQYLQYAIQYGKSNDQADQSVCAFVHDPSENAAEFFLYLRRGADQLGGQAVLNEGIDGFSENVALP